MQKSARNSIKCKKKVHSSCYNYVKCGVQAMTGTKKSK